MNLVAVIVLLGSIAASATSLPSTFLKEWREDWLSKETAFALQTDHDSGLHSAVDMAQEIAVVSMPETVSPLCQDNSVAWLVTQETNIDPTEISLNCEIYFINLKDGFINITEKYSILGRQPVSLRHSQWTNESGLEILNGGYIYERRRDLKGLILRDSFHPTPPLIMADYDESRDVTLSGPLAEIMDVLREHFNFRTEYVKNEGAWGAKVREETTFFNSLDRERDVSSFGTVAEKNLLK